MKVKYIIYALIVVVLGYLIYNRVTAPSPGKEKGAAGKGGGKPNGPMAVNGVIAKSENFTDKLNITGNIVSNEEVSIRSEASGLITNIYFKEGSNVAKGALLIKINDKDLQAQLTKAITMQKLAEEKEYRARILLEKEAVSKEDYDATLADVNALKAETQLIRTQIIKTEIRAPFSGTIGLRSVSVGDYLTPQTDITTLVNVNPAKITFTVPEKYIQLIKRNSAVDFTVEGNKRVYTATVYAIEPKIDEATRTVLLKATAPNNDGSLLPGSFAKVELALKEVKDALFVPTQAVVPLLKGKKVFLCKNGIARDAIIETGARTSDRVQVLSGISPGDTIITTGIMSLKPETPVKVSIN
ncbi:efflux RND transporter periplasmic adaptor subunit [Solitalea canadensis]|uniref:RND family efflux transporter, MFP subunit n=1 Tax=Solitalea canadensis (strain ATCC 29591 / DSM 3403 / JCM 21819 / LMG 8368 / NBRC 15130 / NCIMB 12057 / USAM 9D) TaxID=929556 RepID=H8KNN7_SOLCM|nr:efflux RND transporter periplasmic adaptor subunit [Solitalea canadensis]AFD08170.1 RND family efflux transporter, MFP subunit [Solitalea canadensis DSM 3403]